MNELSGTRYYVVGPTGHLIEARKCWYDSDADRIVLEPEWGDDDGETFEEEK